MKFSSVDEYIAAQSEAARAQLNDLRATILEAAPDAVESIRYDIPSYKLHGRPLISFGAWKRHLGLYPVPVLDAALEVEVAPLRAAKSTMQLPLHTPFPRALVQRVLASIVERNARLAR